MDRGFKPTGIQARMRDGIVIEESDVAARDHGSQRRHRGRCRIATGKANVFGGCSGEHRCSCRSEKHEVFGCPRRSLRSRQLADSKRVCGVKHSQLDFRWAMWPRRNESGRHRARIG